MKVKRKIGGKLVEEKRVVRAVAAVTKLRKP
jgi:hypothetical protein